ncbi:unnamed protein product [Didymodactylos carnosus]|uniref:Uncharacterized protein n=1 Tax=Didymodactylos carnosus TaxID=1234261 RepID=A0A815TCW7_9BILA|nr:unnamed protein product [Didymodactylos carnosus]CAF4365029.1 unnamed protein product [Didymodactylos carnosus]
MCEGLNPVEAHNDEQTEIMESDIDSSNSSAQIQTSTSVQPYHQHQSVQTNNRIALSCGDILGLFVNVTIMMNNEKRFNFDDTVNLTNEDHYNLTGLNWKRKKQSPRGYLIAQQQMRTEEEEKLGGFKILGTRREKETTANTAAKDEV